jgi:hypothetical protein
MKIRRLATALVPVALAAGALGAVVPAHAATPTQVVVNKRCSKTSVANLQVQREDNGKISVDFGVDMARHTPGVAWTVRESRNGVPFANLTTKTIADGSFSVTRLLSASPTNHIAASATSAATGETCSISATL